MKLKINKWAAIIDIVLCISLALYFFYWFILPDILENLNFGDEDPFGISPEVVYLTLIILFYFLVFVGLAINIVALVKSKDVGLSIFGPVLGITGTVLLIIFFVLPALGILIAAAICSWKQEPTKMDKVN